MLPLAYDLATLINEKIEAMKLWSLNFHLVHLEVSLRLHASSLSLLLSGRMLRPKYFRVKTMMTNRSKITEKEGFNHHQGVNLQTEDAHHSVVETLVSKVFPGSSN